MSKIPKPQLRGLLMKKTKRIVPTALVLAALSGIAFNTFYIEKQKQLYKDYYDNLDIDAQFERMAARGIFDSVSATKKK